MLTEAAGSVSSDLISGTGGRGWTEGEIIGWIGPGGGNGGDGETGFGDKGRTWGIWKGAKTGGCAIAAPLPTNPASLPAAASLDDTKLLWISAIAAWRNCASF